MMPVSGRPYRTTSCGGDRRGSRRGSQQNCGEMSGSNGDREHPSIQQYTSGAQLSEKRNQYVARRSRYVCMELLDISAAEQMPARGKRQHATITKASYELPKSNAHAMTTDLSLSQDEHQQPNRTNCVEQTMHE